VGVFRKIVLWVNYIVALLLLVSFILPYIPPSRFPNISLLSLAVSPLLLLNLLFAIYWLVKLNRKFFISFLILIIAFFHFSPFIEISSEGDASAYRQTLKVLSYNVRLFNAYEKDASTVPETISEILKDKDPDVICIQEYYRESMVDFSGYPYKFIHFNDGNNKLGYAIFSKYPLVNTGVFDFEDTHNNSIHADIAVKGDTVRVYNMHLQSLGILPSVGYLQEGDKVRLRRRMTNTFVRQENQAKAILEHKATSPYPVILSGDLNNTPFSYIYRQMQNDMQDAFLKRGSGLGTTFIFDGYPLRIDYILVSEEFEVVNFMTIKKTFSDHYPVFSTLGWEKF
jgi:vancomycin resistance protein VanJ